MLALLEAADCAHDTNSERWDFAVTIRRLQELGGNETDLRWLVRKGFAEHGREVTAPGDNGRQFRSTGDLTFCRRTCFVLTAIGILQARLAGDGVVDSGDSMGPQAGCNGAGVQLPFWDAERRVLSFAGRVVKRFKWTAINQESILAAFQEEGWPSRVDDPLPPQPHQDSKRRLSDTIKCLNREQINQLLRFRGDGTSEGVIWEQFVPECANRRRANGRGTRIE